MERHITGGGAFTVEAVPAAFVGEPASSLAAAHREAAWKVRASAALTADERQARGMRHIAMLHEQLADRLDAGEPIAR
jgi:hypothetical protein